MNDSPSLSPGAAACADATAPHGFRRRPGARAIGDAARGRLILDGHLPLACGWLEGDPFAAIPGSDEDAAVLHGFGWLDDLAAVGTPAARALAQERVLTWVRRNPQVPQAPALAGPEWRADVTGRRVRTWVLHGGILLPGLDRPAAAPVFTALHDQLAYLRRHAAAAAPGLPRLEALAGLALGALSLRGAETLGAPALDALAEEGCSLAADPALLRRNPQALLEAVALLVWTQEVAAEAPAPAPPGIARAIAALAPVLAALRHADGGLPRVHGGGSAPGRLDRVLPADVAPASGLALGFARMARGAATLILDAAPPPAGPDAQASALGLEITVGRTPLIVGCGKGAGFGADWMRAARATACASTATLDRLASARVAAPAWGAELIAPRTVWAGGCDAQGRVTPPDCGPADAGTVAHLLAGHDGWRASHGLTHLRELWLAGDGLSLRGEDSIAAVDEAGRDRLSRIRGHAAMTVALHFHLHPTLGVEEDDEGIALALPDGAVWRFGHDGSAALSLAPSVWFDPAAREPRPAWQVLLTAPLGGFARRIGWTLSRAA